ncbi:MAG TPA: hypothetical protein VFF15_07290 [Flavobacteriaceae bacterium]|nr:hypothetical protein [Flavobacteriaceae bacterium]
MSKEKRMKDKSNKKPAAKSAKEKKQAKVLKKKNRNQPGVNP